MPCASGPAPSPVKKRFCLRNSETDATDDFYAEGDEVVDCNDYDDFHDENSSSVPEPRSYSPIIDTAGLSLSNFSYAVGSESRTSFTEPPQTSNGCDEISSNARSSPLPVDFSGHLDELNPVKMPSAKPISRIADHKSTCIGSPLENSGSMTSSEELNRTKSHVKVSAHKSAPALCVDAPVDFSNLATELKSKKKSNSCPTLESTQCGATSSQEQHASDMNSSSTSANHGSATKKYKDTRSKAYLIKLTPLELEHTKCCDKYCLTAMKEDNIEDARIMFEETSGSFNDKMLRLLFSLLNKETKELELGFRNCSLCVRGFGMVYNIRWTKLHDRMADAKEGVLRFLPAPRTTISDQSLTNDIDLYVERTAKMYSDAMPHTGKRSIPMSKNMLWQYFMAETERVCTFGHFKTVFDRCKAADIQLMPKTTQFSCKICLLLRRHESKLPKTRKYHHDHQLIKEQRNIHFKNHAGQRDEFAANMAAARNDKSKKILMLLTDGMDQRKSRLPMISDTVDMSEMDCLECHIFGCFVVGRAFKSYIDFKHIPHNANQNMTCILNIILEVAKSGPLPREKLIIQPSVWFC